MSRSSSRLFKGVRQLLTVRHGIFRSPIKYSQQPSKQPQTAHDYHPEQRSEQEDLKTKRSRLLYQSKKRGILENDIILGEFADEMLQKMSREQLVRYDEIINGEYMEWDLYYYIAGKKNLPKDLKDCEIFKMLQDFVKKKREEMRQRTTN